MKKDKKLIAQI